jgi:hypothetical protein
VKSKHTMILTVAGAEFLLWVGSPISSTSAQLVSGSSYRVVCDDRGVAVSDPQGSTKSVAWAALSKVAIRTTDDGPRYVDVFWEMFDGRSTAVLVYPGGANGEQECLVAMQTRLKGFRDDQLIRAMGSAQDAHFVLWERQTNQ